MKIKKIVIGIIAAMAAFVGQAESSAPFRLSLKSDGVRTSLGNETLTYSSQWDGGEGATVTIAENGAVVADGLSGEGTRSWSVQKTGEYTLTHTTYTNGIAGKVETATFVVPGPELTFEYDGGPFVGGKVTINGNLDGWTIYYTLDGSAPTTESLKYTGPFTLSSAANLKAYAVSDSGMSTPLIENNYAVVERARIENVRARQRWPWNGKVDIDFDVVGDVTLGASADLPPYLVVTAKDIDTGLTYTITSDDNPLTGDTGTKEGHHRVTWDLDAHGLDIDSLNVEFKVTYQTVPLYCIINIPEDATGIEHVTYTNASPAEGFNNADLKKYRDYGSPAVSTFSSYKKEKIVLRRIENGTFNLGRQHKVTLTQPYYIAIFETTIGQYVRFMGQNISELLDPWVSYRDNQPIHRLYYNEIRGWSSNWPISSDVESGTIISKLRGWTGMSTLDLPTEAEWEYACRAGTISDFNDGSMLTGEEYDTNLNKLGYYDANYIDGIPVKGVGSYKPNAWGLYDMHGNADEWCLDYYQEDGLNAAIDPKGPESGLNGYRVTRGRINHTSYTSAQGCTSFCRSFSEPRTGYGVGEGFRLCLKLTDSHLVGLTNVFITGVSDVTKIDARKETRISSGAETLTYSSQWDGGDGATVTIAQDGAVVADGLSGEGTRPWSVQKTGEYTLTHTTYTNGIAGKVETATFVVTGKDVAFAADDVMVAVFAGKYDGAAHGVGVTVKEGIEDVVVRYAAGDGAPALPWSETAPTITDVGSMTVWCEIAAPGYITQTNLATVVISPREVTLASGSASKVYDGTALVNGNVTVGGDGFVDGEGASYNVTGSQTNVGESENAFVYTLNDNTKAGNYNIITVNGTLTVTKANVGGGTSGGEEPGAGEVPQGGVSKFDASFVYDGKGHTIDTNALVAAFGSAMVGESAIEYAVDDGSGGDGHAGCVTLPWLEMAPVYTNAGEYVVWYRVTNPNYNEFIHAAKLSITKRQVTVSVAGHMATCVYDTTEKTVSGYDIVTEEEFYDVAEDTVFSGGHGETALPSVARTDVGTMAMGLSAANFVNKNENFEVTYLVSDGWLKIEPRIIGDDPANWDIRLARNPMYDGTEQSAPITQVAFVKPDGNLDYIPYELSGNTATDSGNYVVRIIGTGNYSGTVEKEWAITPRNVTLSSGSAEWVYDGEAHSQSAVSVTGDGFAAGEGSSYSAFPIVRHVADAAAPRSNTFEYTLNANTKAQNYVITTVNGTVKMSPRAVTLTAPTKQKQYDGTPLTFGADEVEITETGHAGRETLPNGEAFTLGNFASITEAGRVDATFTVADGTALMADYAITTVPGTLTVRKNATEITVTAKSGSWVYDGTVHTLHEYEATNLGVLQPGDALDVTFSDESVVTTPMDGAEGNGVVENAIAAVCVIRNGKDDVTANYTLAPYNGTLTVMKRPVTLTSKSDSKVYDGEELTAHEIEVGGDGFVGEDGATYVFTGSQTEKGKSKNTFSYSLKGSTNAAFYDITKVEGDLEVTARDIAGGGDEDWEIVFGPALTYTGLEQVQTLSSVTYKGLSLDYTVSGNIQKNAGAYRMTLAGQGNFAGTHEVEWSIAPKALTLTAGSGSRVYDGAPFMVGSVTAVGFVSGEGAEYGCDGAQKDVGTSPNAVSAILWNTNTRGSNYTVTKVAGTLTVTPRPVTLTAANISKPYDGAPLALTAADIVADGIVAGESFVYSNFASRTEAGQTPATFDYAPGAGTSLANYTVTVTPGRTVTITKSATAISVTAESESWVYDGEAHSNRTWMATNLDTLQTGDALEVTFDEASVVKTPQDGANGDGIVPNVITGVRVIRSGAEDVTANYTVEWFPGTLAVTKRPVTVTVVGESATYTYDSEEKTVAGYDISTEDDLYDIAADTVFGGTQSVSRTDAGKTEMGLSAADFTNDNDCFDVTYAVTDGWVKIVPADIATGAEGDFAIVLGENPKYNGTVQTIPVGSVTYKGMDVTYTLAGENSTHAGTYMLTVKANGNFTGERSTTWQVLKRNVTFTSASATKAYDASPLVNPNVMVGGDGFIGIEGAIFDVTGSQTVAGSSKNTFSYTLKASTLAGDYDITKIEGELVVTKANVGGGSSGGEEPGDGEVPQGGISKFDASFVYDGEGHTIDTNALTEVFGNAMAGVSVIEYVVDADAGGMLGTMCPTSGWISDVPVYTNAGQYIVWYRVTNLNYEDFTHAAKLTITPRTGVVVDIVGNVATNVYNGTAQSVDGYTVTINDSLYKETDFEFVGNAAVSGTAPGKYPMGVNSSQFTNKSKNFAGVTFNVTDGELVILELPQKNVILDAIGGAFAIGSVVTQECEDVYLAFPVATREGYVFDGWYLGVTNDAPKATVGASLLVDDDHTLFAKWRIDEALMPGGASIFAWEAIDANTARITGFKNAAQKVSTLLLPDMIEGRFVTEIATGAFANSKSGMTKLVLPVFCTKIGDKAFTGVTSLSEIVFADVRRWDAPSESAILLIGRYAFSGTGLESVLLPKSVGSIGDYAFLNCRKLTNLTILGNPVVGITPLRRAGLDVGGITVHLDPALANDSAYMESLKQECGNVIVRADAIVTRMTLSLLAVSARDIVLSVSVEKAAQWGKVDLSLVKVAYRESFSEKPTILNPLSVTENPDGSLTVRVAAPKGDSGFFQLVLEK